MHTTQSRVLSEVRKILEKNSRWKLVVLALENQEKITSRQDLKIVFLVKLESNFFRPKGDPAQPVDALGVNGAKVNGF